MEKERLMHPCVLLKARQITDCHTRLPKPRYDTETVNKWRKALSQVADLKGLEIKYVAPEAYNM